MQTVYRDIAGLPMSHDKIRNLCRKLRKKQDYTYLHNASCENNQCEVKIVFVTKAKKYEVSVHQKQTLLMIFAESSFLLKTKMIGVLEQFEELQLIMKQVRSTE